MYACLFAGYTRGMSDTSRSPSAPDHKPRQRRRRFTPRRWVMGALAVVLLAAITGIGVKLHRYRTACDTVIALGGDIDFRGPDWARNISEDNPLPWVDRVVSVNLQDCALTEFESRRLVSHLRQFPHLRSLRLSGTGMTETAFSRFDSVGTNLEMLDLSRTQLGDDGVQHLRHLHELKTLHLAGTRVTDEGLRHLAELPSLEVLNLDHTSVSDAGITRLAPLANLKELNVADTDVTDDGVRALARLLPRTKVYDD